LQKKTWGTKKRGHVQLSRNDRNAAAILNGETKEKGFKSSRRGDRQEGRTKKAVKMRGKKSRRKRGVEH